MSLYDRVFLNEAVLRDKWAEPGSREEFVHSPSRRTAKKKLAAQQRSVIGDPYTAQTRWREAQSEKRARKRGYRGRRDPDWMPVLHDPTERELRDWERRKGHEERRGGAKPGAWREKYKSLLRGRDALEKAARERQERWDKKQKEKGQQ